jgi:hypothetical protein
MTVSLAFDLLSFEIMTVVDALHKFVGALDMMGGDTENSQIAVGTNAGPPMSGGGMPACVAAKPQGASKGYVPGEPLGVRLDAAKGTRPRDDGVSTPRQTENTRIPETQLLYLFFVLLPLDDGSTQRSSQKIKISAD